MRLTLPNGREYDFAPLGYTEEACRLLELQESMDEDGFRASTFLRCLRANMIQSLIDGGSSSDDAVAAVASIQINDKETVHRVMAAMLE